MVISKMEFRSFSDLNESVRSFATNFNEDIDLIVGIPRSGMLVANLLALYLELPMTDVDGLCHERIIDAGRRFDGGLKDFSEIDRVLVVDDSVNSGRQMTEARKEISRHHLPFEIEYGAIYISLGGNQYIDYWEEVVLQPRLFEWNIMHHPGMEKWCVDIDGVLCRDPSSQENDDGERYREFITTVNPRFLPSKKIGWLVTCRLERYREETEAWLDRHGIEYGKLIMMDLPSKESRQKAGNHAQYKADVYESTGATLFIESSHRQAEEIAAQTGKPAYCFGSNQMLRPEGLLRTRKERTFLSRFVESPVSFSAKTGLFVINHVRPWLHSAAGRFRDG